MPLLGCSVSVTVMIGLLGLLGWKVTVISSNFIALMLILNMAMNIHITVRFLQLKKEFPDFTNHQAVLEASKKMFMPILYTVLTTVCAFLSLIFSGIKPIIDFGWMMTIGLIVSIFVTFTLLPSLLSIFASNDDVKTQDTEKSKITSALSNFSKKYTKSIFGSTILIISLSIFGISKLLGGGTGIMQWHRLSSGALGCLVLLPMGRSTLWTRQNCGFTHSKNTAAACSCFMESDYSSSADVDFDSNGNYCLVPVDFEHPRLHSSIFTKFAFHGARRTTQHTPDLGRFGPKFAYR